MTTFLLQFRSLAFAFTILQAGAQQKTIFHYRLNDHHAALVASGSVPSTTTSYGDGTTGDFGTVITLSSDIPVKGIPVGAGNRSINCAGTGGVRADGVQQMLNADIMAAGGFTFEAWFKYNGAGNVNSIIDYAGTEKLDRTLDGTGVRMQTNNGIFHPIADTGVGEWHYVAAVFTATSMAGVTVTGDYTYYLNGLEAVATETGVTISDFGDGLNRTIGVGMHPQGFGGDFLDGLIYEPRATLKALAPEALLFTPDPVKDAILADAPLAYYRFNDRWVKQPDPDDMRPTIYLADGKHGPLILAFQTSERTNFSGTYQAFENGSATPLSTTGTGGGTRSGSVRLSATNPMVEGNIYTVRIPGEADSAGNVVHPSTETSFTYSGKNVPIPDSSGNGKDAGFINDVRPIHIGANEALTFQSASFGGTNQYAEIPDLGTGLGAMTFSGWLKIDTDVPVGCCTSLYSPDGFGVGTPHINIVPGLIGEFSISGATPSRHHTPGPLPLDQWFHLAIVFDRNAGANGTTQFFVDGKSFGGVQPFNATPPALNLGLGQLGGWSGDPLRNFNGNMDEIAIFGSALTSAQIKAHLAPLEGPHPPEIIHFESLNEFGDFTITFTSEPSANYLIELSDDLVTWPLAVAASSGGETTTVNQSILFPSGRLFLRVIRE